MTDWKVVAVGAGMALFVLIPTIALAALVGTGRESNANFFFYVPVVVGLAFGGWVAARRRRDAPLSHGCLAALAAYILVAFLITSIRVADGRALNVTGLIFNGFVAASAGIFGGLLATRRRALQ
ncbi:MAG: TIGR04086 family membrane protein [Actinomycetota bacterium]|nr:TIGR04086 family membrane protein [Actinomycetota bacterium]